MITKILVNFCPKIDAFSRCSHLHACKGMTISAIRRFFGQTLRTTLGVVFLTLPYITSCSHARKGQISMDLRVVRDMKYDSNGVIIEFGEDTNATFSAHLNKSDNYDYYIRLAQRSLERSHPVGVQLNRHRKIVALKRADNDFVARMENENNKKRVFFQGHNGIFWIHPDHPEAGKMTEMLRNAISNRKRVWFVADCNLHIQAVRTLSEQ